MPLLTISEESGLPSFNITGASALRNLDYGNVTQFDSFILTGSNGITMPGVTAVNYLITDRNLFFPNLTSAQTMKINFTDSSADLYAPIDSGLTRLIGLSRHGACDSS